MLGPIDHFTLAVNLFILVFSKWFATRYGVIKDKAKSQARLRILHVTNLILFTTYLIAVVFEIHLGRAISQTFLVVLASYLLIHFAEAFILRKYGKSKTIENFARTTETHTSRTLELFVLFIIITITFVLLINIWGLEDWLQTTSVLGFIALFIFASKEYWAGDFLSGILIISQGRIERGDVIMIKDEGLSMGMKTCDAFFCTKRIPGKYRYCYKHAKSKGYVNDNNSWLGTIIIVLFLVWLFG